MVKKRKKKKKEEEEKKREKKETRKEGRPIIIKLIMMILKGFGTVSDHWQTLLIEVTAYWQICLLITITRYFDQYCLSMIRDGTKRYTQQHSRLKGKSNLKGFWNHHVLFRRILPRFDFCDRGLPLDAKRSHETTESSKKLSKNEKNSTGA